MTDTAQPVRLLTIDGEQAGRRVDNVLSGELSGLPTSRIYRMIRRGEVRINGKRCKPHAKLAEGDILRIPPVRLRDKDTDDSVVMGAAALNGLLLYEDDKLLVLDKPAGIAVHGGSGLRSGVIERLRIERDEPDLNLVHRLDRDTSGVLLIARKHSMLRLLHQALRERQMRKTYWILVAGNWPEDCGRISLPLKRGESLVRDVQIDEAGQSAVTDFKVLSRHGRYTQLRAYPHTGRTHQLRVHAASANCPIVGDTRYGNEHYNRSAQKQFGLKRMFLHAERLQINAIKLKQEFHAPLPVELKHCLERLAEAD